MSRPLTGTKKQTATGWHASLPAHRGAKARQSYTFRTEYAADRWLAAGCAAITVGEPAGTGAHTSARSLASRCCIGIVGNRDATSSGATRMRQSFVRQASEGFLQPVLDGPVERLELVGVAIQTQASAARSVTDYSRAYVLNHRRRLEPRMIEAR